MKNGKLFVVASVAAAALLFSSFCQSARAGVPGAGRATQVLALQIHLQRVVQRLTLDVTVTRSGTDVYTVSMEEYSEEIGLGKKAIHYRKLACYCGDFPLHIQKKRKEFVLDKARAETLLAQLRLLAGKYKHDTSTEVTLPGFDHYHWNDGSLTLLMPASKLHAGKAAGYSGRLDRAKCQNTSRPCGGEVFHGNFLKSKDGKTLKFWRSALTLIGEAIGENKTGFDTLGGGKAANLNVLTDFFSAA